MQELEHFVDAGVDAIWMSPIFKSPMVDFGYDISNFYEIHEDYGTMEQFDELLKRAHELGKFFFHTTEEKKTEKGLPKFVMETLWKF